MTAYASGFGLGLSLIVAIGAQNALVLRQGLLGRHVLAVCTVCAVSDAVLIALGVAGAGVLAAAWPWALEAMRYAGALFLGGYGLLRLRSAWTGGAALSAAEARSDGLRATLGICIALTWANPHVWLDTVVLIGGLAQQQGTAAWTFGAGAITASFVFFFGLGYGAALLRPLFANPRTWRVLDLAVALVMFALALGLLRN
jgi:L-lysine exporter family protein LysE/ArgO